MSNKVNKDKVIYVAGHNGLVGRATVSLLRKKVIIILLLNHPMN